MTIPSSLTILHCIRAPVGGAFRHVRDLALAQEAAGHKVGIICDALTGGSFEAAQIEALTPHLRLGILRVPMRRALSPSDLAVTVRLVGWIGRARPDVLHGHGAKGGAYVRLIGTALRLAGRRPARIYCPHGGSLHFDPASAKGRVIFTLERALERLTDGLHFVSGYEADTYSERVGSPRIPAEVIHNGLQAEEFDLVAPTAGAHDFLFIGALRELKGVDVFIDALAVLRDRGIRTSALIVGSGEMADAYHAQVADLGLTDSVAFAAPMPIREALPRARAMVVPSRAESLPYVVLEAIAAGVPTLATRVGGIAEIFGARADLLLPPGDVAALADAMAATLARPDAAVADVRGLRDAIRDQFSARRMADAIEELYRDVSPRRAAAPEPDAACDLPPTLPLSAPETERAAKR